MFCTKLTNLFLKSTSEHASSQEISIEALEEVPLIPEPDDSEFCVGGIEVEDVQAEELNADNNSHISHSKDTSTEATDTNQVLISDEHEATKAPVSKPKAKQQKIKKKGLIIDMHEPLELQPTKRKRSQTFRYNTNKALLKEANIYLGIRQIQKKCCCLQSLGLNQL
jgi:hypothetical protein